MSAMLHQKSSKGHCFSDWTVFLGFQLKTMHPGPSPQVVKAHSPSQEDGGEGEDYSNMAVVKTSCTEVCGPGQLILMLKNLPHKTVPKGFQGHGHQSLRNSRRLEQLLISQS